MPAYNFPSRADDPSRETPLDCRGVIAPTTLYTFNVGTGAINCTNTGGLVSKSHTNGGNDITTLITFTYPPESAGKTCTLQFFLAGPDVSLDGTGQIDVFSILAPAPGCTDSWPPGNGRNIHLGRWNVDISQYATWDWTSSSYLTQPTTCAAPGTVEAYEFVGVGDYDLVQWGDSSSAPFGVETWI
ncbi:hypothetical protein B0T22DRAFT_444301 [Podospora appendiculata]|uniref:Ubiquitin 3 binding protein But2 C-terminal domain-containing protein n=1 Tax=Podospora appendiculata TaxID=314037 RepID=A0AAE1C7Q3_9PEZI|nr:hypothetical protein B0T22DRAFT_444301 [Podospora appendiculata]